MQTQTETHHWLTIPQHSGLPDEQLWDCWEIAHHRSHRLTCMPSRRNWHRSTVNHGRGAGE